MSSKKSGEESTKLSEHLKIIESIGEVGTWSYDLSSGRISWSDQMFEIFPESKEKGEPDFERHRSTIHEEDRDYWQSVVQKCSQDGKPYQMDFRTCHPDGKVVWVRALGKGLLDYSGKVIGLQGTCQDVSGYKKLEKEKEEIQSMNERLQSVGNIGGWKLDLDTGRTQWTTHTYEIHKIPVGTPTDKIKGIEFYLEHERAKILDLIEKCTRGIPFDDTFEFKDAEGTLKWVRSIGLPVYTKSGEITHLEGTFQDVSEQVKREEELRESKTYFSLAMQGANLGVWDWYLGDNSVKFDARWCQMLGLDVNEIPMELSTWESRVHPDDLESCYTDIKTYLDGKTEYYENVHRMKHADGHWVYILDRGRISDWDADGNPTRFTGTHMDITEVESLKRERDHIFSEFKIGTFKWDIVNNHVEWDANNFKVFGVDEKDFGNAYEAWASCLHPDWTERAQQDVQDALQGNEGFDTIFRVKTSDDSPKYIRGVAKIERNKKGEPLFMTGLNMDVTAQYIAEKELERKKEVDIHQAKLASIGELAAGVGHEINNPLSIINGYLKMLERRIVGAAAKDEKVSELTHKIGQASERIKNIVKGLRNFSRAIDNETSEFSLKEVIEESVDMLREIYLSEGVHVSLDLSGSKDDFFVSAVRGQLQQIILNLIANAKDASEGCENRKIEISLFTEGDQHVLQVSDNGKGIPSAIAKKIFEPFFTTKEVNRGTGIGLSMAQRLAGHNSGSIDFHSVEGEGTDFFLRLPQHIKKTLAPDLSHDSGPHSDNEKRKYRVLLLDDEEDIREIVGFQLENMGFEVHGFATGAEALESIESGGLQYDFVISDVKMPVMSGGQFLNVLRSKHRNSYRYFVFMTGGTNIDFEDPSNEFKDKIDGYIYKPFSEEALGHLLLNLVDSEEQVPAAALAKAS